MKVTVELPDWIVAMLLRARIPEEICGASIEDRLVFLADDMAVAILEDQAIEQDGRADESKYRSLRISESLDKPDDDDIPF
jgi:hypothetical protein